MMRRLRRAAGRLRHGGTAAALALMTLGLAVTVFVQVADEVIEGEWHWLDEKLLRALRVPGQPGDPLGPPWFEEMVRDFTAFGGLGPVVFVTLAACGHLVIARRRDQAVLVAAAVAGGALASSLLKAGFDRPRPDLVAHGMAAYQTSFPSGHSMMSAVVYLSLGVLLARLLDRRRRQAYVVGVAAVLVLLVGASRVYLGVHWPSDVLAGWAAGVGWAAACWLAALAIGNRASGDRPASPAPPGRDGP